MRERSASIYLMKVGTSAEPIETKEPKRASVMAFAPTGAVPITTCYETMTRMPRQIANTKRQTVISTAVSLATNAARAQKQSKPPAAKTCAEPILPRRKTANGVDVTIPAACSAVLQPTVHPAAAFRSSVILGPSISSSPAKPITSAITQIGSKLHDKLCSRCGSAAKARLIYALVIGTKPGIK